MPDFDVRFEPGYTASPAWSDERLSHRGANVHRYRRIAVPSPGSPTDVVLKCIVIIGGAPAVAPLDVDLGGRLFTAVCTQFGGTFPPGILQAAAQSSLITLRFGSQTLGHHEIVVRRPEGGTITLSVEVE